MSKNLINIFKYFGNKDFEQANSERQFSISEMLSIMVHSHEIAIEEMVEDMRTLQGFADEETKARIEKCMSDELMKLEYIKSLDADDIRFMNYCSDIVGKSINVQLTFDELMASGVNDESVFINAFSDPVHRSATIAHFYVKNGNVTSTMLTSKPETSEVNKEFAKTDVSLYCPFKPFDLIEVGGKRYIVADMNSSVPKNERESFGWINMTLPVYRVAEDGTISIDVISKMPWLVSEIRKVNAKYLTLADMEQVEYIKSNV